MEIKKIQALKGDEVQNILIKLPTNEEIEQSDLIFASKIASLIKKNQLIPQSKLADYLKSNELWTNEDEEKVKELRKETDVLMSKLRKGGLKLSEGRSLAIQVTEKRRDLLSLLSRLQQYQDATIESVAMKEQMDFMVYCVAYKDDKNKHWSSFEDMKMDRKSDSYNKVYDVVYEMVHGVGADIDKTLPEVIWLKKYGFVDDELRYIDRKTKARVDKDGNLVDEDEARRVLENTFSEIKEEQPFLDDDTSEPVVIAENNPTTV